MRIGLDDIPGELVDEAVGTTIEEGVRRVLD